MDHHTNWFQFVPGYHALQETLQTQFATSVGGGHYKYETVHHIFAAALVAIILIVMSLVARARFADVEKAIVPPKTFGVAAFFELIYETLTGMMETVIGEGYKRYVPVIGTCALFILLSNLIGLIPGFVPPTDNLNTTAACSLVVFAYFNYHGFRTHGIGHITHLLNPIGEWWGWFLTPLLGTIEVIGLFVRIVSLSLRLMGNMVGDHMVLFAFAGMMPLLLPLPFYALGTLVCIIQAAVFCILSTVYIVLHTADAH